jgi:DNA repair photolyase
VITTKRGTMTTSSSTSGAETNQSFSIHYTVDSFANGIAFGQHKLPAGEDPRDHYQLKIDDDHELVRLRSRYTLNKQNPFCELERHLMRLSSQGVLRSSTIYFGVATDPFLPFEAKFDASMKFLELFKRYTPGMLIIQTRSPLLVIAMPVLTRLGAHCAVTLGVETNLEESARKYTPGLPRVEERLKMATALRRFGIEVNIQVGPVLPYGDWRADAGRFADLLVEHADGIHVSSITDGSDRTERRLRNSPLAKRLAQDRKFHWLRADSATPLISEIEKRAPQKLMPPNRPQLQDKQVRLFA